MVGWLRGGVLTVAGVAVPTSVFWMIRGFLGEGDTALLYLPVVAILAALGGIRVGLLAAILSYAAGMYLFTPRYGLKDPRDLVSLAVFLGIGLAMGLQSARARALQVLASQADALREADRLKTNLIRSVSHELKTPLASVTATVTNLLEPDVAWDAAAVRRQLEYAADDLERLNESIGSLVELSLLESGAWAPRLEWCELGEILGTTERRLPAVLRPRIRIKLPADLPLLHVDYAQWVRALQHLLENALAYSSGPVRVGAALAPAEVRLWVEDEGPGVLESERSLVFQKFFRGSASTATPGGTGIGLAITQEIVHFHGGRIWIEDARPRGARFSIALPLSS